jgi:ligand-binding SRPBCC domain-containing protein
LARIELSLLVAAPPSRCFDLARSVDAHVRSVAATGERAIGGQTTGLLGLGDEVTWRARHLGVWQELTSRITAFDRPLHFRDSMVRGAFARFDHDHYFEAANGDTLLRDVFDYSAPLGPLGWLAERLFLSAYMRRLLLARMRELKALAESDAWVQFVPPVTSVKR